MLTASIRNLPFVRAIWILDPEGNMIHDSERLPGKYNLSDREYFQVQKAAPQAGLYIEGPIKSKHGVWFIAASVGIKGADGRAKKRRHRIARAGPAGCVRRALRTGTDGNACDCQHGGRNL
jgi:hypothetical protein